MKFPLLLALLLPLSLVCAQDQSIDDATARLEMARVLRDGGKLAEAINEYQKVLETDPDNTEAANDLAQALVWSEKADEAAKVLANIPADKLTKTGLDAAIDLDIREGKGEEAEKKLRALLKETPEDDRTLLRLAEVLSWSKQYNESLEIFTGLVERYPDDVQLRRKYAQVLGWAGKPEAAAEQWKTSLKE